MQAQVWATTPYRFDGPPSREVLGRYLRRAITMAGLCESETLADDVRMLLSLGAKYIGRAAFVWDIQESDTAHFERAARLAACVHAGDPETVLQACVFEAVYESVGEIEVPRWAFEAFGLEPTRRCFSYADMLFPDGRMVGQWGPGGSVPDLTRLESQMWFYYRARRYIDAGYEAIHLGQVHLVANTDRGYRCFASLLGKIRAYARTHARRHWAICDAHTHGLVVDGRVLLDVHARILFPREIEAEPQQVRLLPQGGSLGGIAPAGWSCGQTPVLLEIDNYGGSCEVAPPVIRPRRRDGSAYRPGDVVPGPLWPWGYDEIAWFARQDEGGREAFLRYAQRWICEHVPSGYLLMPGRRTLGAAPLPRMGADGQVVSIGYFQANNPGPDCPNGFGLEGAIRRLWNADEPLPAPPTAAAVPPPAVDEETGFQLPDNVVLTGTLQGALGGQDWNPDSAVGRMTHAGGGRYTCRCVFPRPGQWQYRVCVGGSWTENYGPGGIADGGNFTLSVPRANTVVTFEFDYIRKELACRMADG